MTTQIVIHLLPHEIDWFEWQLKQLKQGSYHLEEKDGVIIDVTLNLNLIEWAKSQLPKQFFIDKFIQIEKLCDWCETQFTIDDRNGCLGCNDKRREAIRLTKADNIIYLDTDLIFKPELLKYAIDASEMLEIPYYIISPQITKMWDSSWDCLVNPKHIDKPLQKDLHTIDPYAIADLGETILLNPIDQFKIGGGWFNLFSTQLLKHIDIPDSLGPYGLDDTYVMACCNMLRQKGTNIQQYVLEGTLVAENYKYRWSPYENYLYSIDKQTEFRQQAQINFSKEITNMYNRL
jgi:hypothetical protein